MVEEEVSVVVTEAVVRSDLGSEGKRAGARPLPQWQDFQDGRNE